MPVSVRKIDGYRVSTPHGVHARRTTRKKAERQANLLRAVEHGWHPTGKPARESVHTEAQGLVNALLEVDEIGSLPIPASGKAYARIHGMRGLRSKQQAYIRMCRDLGDRGKSTFGFPNREGSAFTGPKHEAVGGAPVKRRLERGHVEKTHLSGGRYGKGVNPKGKTSGAFRMPSQWVTPSALKY
jgi:hypothetical protein